MSDAAEVSDVPSSIDQVASNKSAALVNQQWADYQARFQPQETKIIDQMGSGLQTTFLPKSLQNAQRGVTNAYASAAGQQQRDLSRIGQSQTTEQVNAQITKAGLSQAASSANANNTAVQNDQNLKNEIMSGGLGAAAVTGNK